MVNKKVFTYLTQAQEETFAVRTVAGGHKHWAKVQIDPRTGTASITTKTGRRAMVTRRGRILGGALPRKDWGAYA